MLRDANDTGSRVSRILFEDISAIAENAAVFSGAAPGRALLDITLRRVNITISKVGNYSVSATSGPTIEYDPHLPGVPDRRSLAGWMPGIFAERVEGLRLEDVHVRFDRARAQSYWGTQCVNTSAAGFPVAVVGGSCEAPA